MIHSRVAWIFLPVLRSITVSAPHFVAQRIFSTSSSTEDATALLPMLALIFTRKLRPLIIVSDDRWRRVMVCGAPGGRALPGHSSRFRRLHVFPTGSHHQLA